MQSERDLTVVGAENMGELGKSLQLNFRNIRKDEGRYVSCRRLFAADLCAQQPVFIKLKLGALVADK